MLTSTQVDDLSAVYATLPAGLGLLEGMVRQVPNTNKFAQLVKADALAAASLKVGAALKLTSTTAVGTSIKVDMTSSNADPIFAVNDNVSAAVPAGSFFWATISGPCTLLTKTGASAATFQVGNATTGATADAAAWAATTVNRLLLLAANASGGDALRQALLLGGL